MPQHAVSGFTFHDFGMGTGHTIQALAPYGSQAGLVAPSNPPEPELVQRAAFRRAGRDFLPLIGTAPQAILPYCPHRRPVQLSVRILTHKTFVPADRFEPPATPASFR